MDIISKITGLISGIDPIASWQAAIVIVAVVTCVVAALLAWIIAVAKAIEADAAVIWANGQRVANNTIHIAALYKTCEFVEGILGRAGRIVQNAEAVRTHAEQCGGCPQCILNRR